MSIFNKLFGKKEEVQKKDEKIEFVMPMSGEVIDISEIPDPVFSKKMMGDGFGIKPSKDSNDIFAPVSGEVVSIFPTKHALGIKTKEGIEILLHVGIDTVNLKGEGFEAFVEQGDKIQAGDKILSVNFNEIESKVPSIITPIIFTAIEGYTFEVVKGSKTAKENNVINIVKG